MVQFMSSENNNVWQLPEPEVKPLPLEDHMMYSTETHEDGPFPKRWRSSSSGTDTQQLRINNNELPIAQSLTNQLNEPSPLGLRLRKSPSLLELVAKRVNQGRANKRGLVDENLEARTKRDSRARTKTKASGSPDKLKASHFPALLLRIGQWEYASKYEGDLVAKCYFSKHKIVWEVLDGGLKKKFEMNWADIMALKANYDDDGRGTLTIALTKQPLFFKEINPQPRKHTQWRATSDFTGGEASRHRQHFLQCSQGILDKHYEKLIQCDSRLNFLSQHQDMVLEFPYFPQTPAINDHDFLANNVLNLPEMNNMSYMTSLKNVGSSSLGLIHQDTYSSSSGMSMDHEGPKDMMEIPNNSTLENISEILLGDSHLNADSDENTIISRVNSLCCLLQDYQSGQQDGNAFFAPDPNLIPHQAPNDPNLIPQQYINDLSTIDPNMFLLQDGNYPSTLGPNLIQNDGSTLDPSFNLLRESNDGSTIGVNGIPEKRAQEDGSSSSVSVKLPQEYPISQTDGNDGSTLENESGSNEGSGITRSDSFSDLFQQLPRIASLPRFLFEISENGEILK